jgi:hypothetical protein
MTPSNNLRRAGSCGDNELQSVTHLMCGYFYIITLKKFVFNDILFEVETGAFESGELRVA